MIIVSQNKESIYNFNNIKSIDVIKNEIYLTDDIISDCGTEIAEYKTEERAKEVLEDLVLFYSKCVYDNRFSVYRMPEE